MRALAAEISHTLRQRAKLEKIAADTESAGVSYEAQKGSVDVCNRLYGVLQKEASFKGDGKDDLRFCELITKMASALGKEKPSAETQLKLAGAVMVDLALQRALNDDIPYAEKTKLAAQQLYGREYLADLLTGVL